MQSIKSFISRPMRKCWLILISISLLPFAQAGATNGQTDMVLGIVSTKTTAIEPLKPLERDMASIYGIMYDSLIEINDDYRPVGRLAKDWTQSNAGKTWRITLRENITFSDGTALTANDVVATTKHILALAGLEQVEGEEAVDRGYYQNLKYFIKSVSAIDDLTVEFKTNRSYYGFLYALTYPILPADKIEMHNPPGTGAYIVRQFDAQNAIWLQANPNWWQLSPVISDIMVIMHPNNKELISAYEYSRVDTLFTRSISASQYKTGVSSVSLDCRTRQLEVLYMSHTEQALQSVNVRKAIRYAINIDQIVSQIYMGMADRADSIILPGTWLSKEYEGEFMQDTARAIALLEEDGWFDSDDDDVRDRIVNDKAQKLHLRLFVYEEPDNDVRVATANAIADSLRAIGFSVKVETDTFANIAAKLKSPRSFDLVLCSVNMDPVQDPGFLLMSGNTMNYGRYANKAMDALFTTLRNAYEADDYRAALHDIQDLFVEDCPFISLFYRKGTVVSRRMYTLARQIRELELLRGIDTFGR